MLIDTTFYSVALYDDNNNIYTFTCRNKETLNKIEELMNEFFNEDEGIIVIS